MQPAHPDAQRACLSASALTPFRTPDRPRRRAGLELKDIAVGAVAVGTGQLAQGALRQRHRLDFVPGHAGGDGGEALGDRPQSGLQRVFAVQDGNEDLRRGQEHDFGMATVDIAVALQVGLARQRMRTQALDQGRVADGMRVRHAQRREELARQIGVNLFAGQLLDDHRQQRVVGRRIGVAVTRRRQQRHGDGLRHQLLRRVVLESIAAKRLVHENVGDAGRVVEQVFDGELLADRGDIEQLFGPDRHVQFNVRQPISLV
jgi:hypothetical protein